MAMNLNDIRMMLAAVTGTKMMDPAEGTDFFDARLAATILRYEKILKNMVDIEIQQHLSRLTTKRQMMMAMEAYDKDYFVNLDMPYSGIQRLCGELARVCKTFKFKPPQLWLDYYAGRFDWNEEVDTLARDAM